MALLAVSVGSTAAAVALVGASDGRTTDTWPTIASVLNWDVVMIISGVIACLVARRQPENPTGWLLGGGGSVGALASAADAYGGYALLAFPGTVPGGTAGIFASAVGLYVAWVLLAVHLPLRFPNGSLLSRRWRVVGWAGTTGAVLCGIEILHPAAFDDDELFYDLPTVTNPIGVAGAGDLLTTAFGIGILVIFGATFVAIASLVVRFRRAGGEERLQLKWVALAVTFVVISNLLIANLHDKLPDPFGSGLFTLSAFLVFLIPASLGVSILKYRLYGVDTLLVRAVVYGSMAAFVTAVYIAVAVGVLGGNDPLT